MSPGIKSFGYSLSGRLDMDFNGYSGEVIKLGSQVVFAGRWQMLAKSVVIS